MWRHGKALVEIFAVTALAAETALLTSSLIIAICALLAGLDVAFVLAIAWMRPAGSAERRAVTGAVLDDAER